MRTIITIPVPSERQYYTEAYQPGLFHPVHINEIYNSRYKVLRKLGFGVYSTVWLVQDLNAPSAHYVAMKVLTAQCYGGGSDVFELDILRQLREADPKHQGYDAICHLLDEFECEGPNGVHMCMIFPLMGQDLRDFGKQFRPAVVPGEILKRFAKQVLQALDYAHSLGIIHTDITPNNIMIRLHDEKNVERFLEKTGLILEKVKGAFGLASIEDIPAWGNPAFSFADFHMGKSPTREAYLNLDVCLADWGVACWEDKHLTEEILPECLRSPELLIGAAWNNKVDIWTLGCILLELLEDRRMFSGELVDDDGQLEYDAWWHLCEITELLGPLPKTLLARRDEDMVGGVFDDEGTIDNYQAPRRGTLETCVTRIAGKEKVNFANFLKTMLFMDPEKRKGANELLGEPWLVENHYEESRAILEAEAEEQRRTTFEQADKGSEAAPHPSTGGLRPIDRSGNRRERQDNL